jgi:hypothetical protein
MECGIERSTSTSPRASMKDPIWSFIVIEIAEILVIDLLRLCQLEGSFWGREPPSNTKITISALRLPARRRSSSVASAS